MEINDLTHTIIGGAYKVHNVLGFGFLERVYENALRIELEKLGIRVLQKQELNVWYDNQIVGDYVPDLWLPEKLIIEVKSVQNLAKGTRSKIGPLPRGYKDRRRIADQLRTVRAG